MHQSRAHVIPENVEKNLMITVKNNWDSKTAIITTRGHSFGEMIAINENIYQLYIAMVLPRNSYFTEVFNEILYKLLANGYITELYSNFKNQKLATKTSNTGLLSMNDVVGLILICLGGYFVAIVAFGCEVVSVLLHTKSRKKVINFRK